jgi:hypothetical protein
MTKTIQPEMLCGYRPGIPGVGDGFWVNTDEVNKIAERIKRPMNAVLVFYALSSLANEARSKVVNAGIYCLVGKSGISERAIRKAIVQLEQTGIISVERLGRQVSRFTILGEVRL